MTGVFPLILSGCFAALVLFAAIRDVASFRIPNAVSVGLVSLFCLSAAFLSRSWSEIGWSLLTAALTLAVALLFFARGWIGGGDGKLAAAIALWLGPAQILPGLVYAGLAGGALTLFLIVFRAWPLPTALARQSWILRLHDPREGIPYGAALAVGALFAFPHSVWGHRLLGLEGGLS